MLKPDDRQLLMEALRPPDEYKVDFVLAATFSLDLLALLTSTLAFSSFDWQDEEGAIAIDPLALLETIRRHSGRTVIFCQAGQIAVPRKSEILFSHLESAVFEASAPKGNFAFHPKLWVIRFEAPSQPVRYRLLCPSRNITFDRSWDTMLVLEGTLIKQRRAFEANIPLCDFVGALPRLTRRPLSAVQGEMIGRVQAELRRVHFDPPQGFDEVAFWPLGVGRTRQWPFEGRIDRLLVVSPFISEGMLSKLQHNGRRHVLVSRSESLAAFDPDALGRFDRVYAWNDEANAEDVETTEPDYAISTPNVGLHAKLYVADEGWNARLWTGSANATNAAFGGNVEFLVELRGKKSLCGIDTLLAPSSIGVGLIDLLKEFRPGPDAVATDPLGLELEKLVGELHWQIAHRSFVAKVVPSTAPNEFRMSVSEAKEQALGLSEELQVKCWPVTLHEDRAVHLPHSQGIASWDFGVVSFEALTSFFAFEATASREGRRACSRFVLNLPLEGAPEDRQERILRSLLGDRAKFLRFLLLLLGEWEPGNGGAPIATVVESMTKGSDSTSGGIPLFEAMVRALDRGPEKLDEIARLIGDLRATADGVDILPPDFDEIWQPIWAAREMARR